MVAFLLDLWPFPLFGFSLVSCGFSLVVAFLSKHPSSRSSVKAAASEQIKLLLAANDSFVRSKTWKHTIMKIHLHAMYLFAQLF